MTQRLFAISLMFASGFAALPFLPTSAHASTLDPCDAVLACAAARQAEKCGVDAECHSKETQARNNRINKFFGF